MDRQIVTPVSYDRKTGYVIDAEGFNIAHCYVNEWALELVNLINDTDHARQEATRMADVLDRMYQHNEATRWAVAHFYGVRHSGLITKWREEKEARNG
jgi:hypothetical protein